MSITKSDLARVIAELQELSLSKLQRISQPSQEEFIFQIRRPGHTYLLALYLSPPDERLHLITQKPPSLPHPTAFCMGLRKHLMNKRLETIEQFKEDRIIQMKWANKEEACYLFVELIPRRANILLCNEQLELIQSYQGVSATRGLRRGDVYTAPSRPEIPHSPARPREIKTGQVGDSQSKEPFTFNFQLAEKFAAQTSKNRLRRYKQMALKSRRSEIKKLRRLLQNLQRDLQKCQENLKREHDGELLKHNLHTIERGATEIEVTDYYDPEMKTRIITLDPTRSPQHNLERIFRKSKRARKGLASIQPRMEEAEFRQLELEEEIAQIEEMTEEEALLGLIPEQTEQTKGKKKKTKTLPYREYLSSDGKQIWVGKNNRNNDELTFRVARGNDHWLHVRGIPGSHVLLPVDRGQQPSTEQLIDGATLAAHFSKARGELHVDIMHTQTKYVKKQKGALPGQVSVMNDKNIALRLEQERLNRLLQANQQ